MEVHSHEHRHFRPKTPHGILGLGEEQYQKRYKQSIEDPAGFWGEVAQGYDWFAKWDEDKVMESNFITPKISWFEGGKTNVTVNCLDRHVASGLGDKPAVTFEGDSGYTRQFTYSGLLEEVCRFGNVLRSQGVRKGDRVTLCLPMVPQLLISVLACARIGAIHSVVFAGFSAEAVADRIVDAGSMLVVTADAGMRGGKAVPLKSIVDDAIRIAEGRGAPVSRVLVTRREALMAADASPGLKAPGGTGDVSGSWFAERDANLDMLAAEAPTVCEPEVMDAEDPLFILYTSGSTGKPKGVLHTTGGYMVYAGETFKHIFDHPGASGASSCDDVHFCTADIGWITGHSYLAYGPLLNGAHSIMFEGVPTFPHPGRLWEVCEKHKVTTFYTAPTALRALMVHGDDPVKKHDLSSLRVLGTVGEPINPEAWTWYHDVVGGGKLPVVDTWWQTETGGVMITPLPGVTTLVPGSATKPFFGVKPVILHADGQVAGTNEAGYLAMGQAWPGMMRTVYGDHARFREAYFEQFPGYYTTGDGGRIDHEGNVWIMGRMDDVMNVSGHRLGTAEVESALVEHAMVVEAAVVGTPHPIKGQGIYCFVTLRADAEQSDELRKQLRDTVRASIGPIASPDAIHFTQELPKTRSGKIMRRLLRKIAHGDINDLGDTSTLADASVIARLVEGRQSAH